MTTRVLVSPGVFTTVIDGTIRPADPAGIATAIVSPRVKGPAFEPILVKDRDEDEQLFGKPSSDGKDFGAYTARAFLEQEVNPTMQIRLLGKSDTGITPGYSVPETYAIVASGSNVVAIIQSSGAVTLQGTLTGSSEELAINIANYGVVTASLHVHSDKYIKKVLNTDPSQFNTQKHVVFSVYDYASKTPAVTNAFAAVRLIGAESWTDDYVTASSNTIISQPFDATEWDLFGVGSKFAGDSSNSEFKVSILGIKKSVNEGVYPYGTFSLVVRKYDDNDKAPVVLESFSNLSLDPDSPNYVCRRIGDTYKVWNASTKKFDEFGDYQSKSKYIYVQPSTDLKNGNVPETALPYGFKGYPTFASGAFSDKAPLPDFPFVQTLSYKSDFNTKVYWGVEPVSNVSGALNFGVLDRAKHFPDALTAASGSTGNKFSLKWLSASVQNFAGFSDSTRLTDVAISALSTSLSYSANAEVSPVTSGSTWTGYLSLANIENTDLAKFTFLVTDGFDGLDITLENPLDPANMQTTTTYQTYAYRTAIDMLSNGDEYEISELVTPGIWADKIVSYGIDMVEDRGDTFYIADISGSTVSDVVDDRTTQNWDTPVSAVYYPWVKLKDQVNNKEVYVPPTVVVPAAFAYNDSVSFPWWAPAGLTRGGLRRHGVIRAKDKLNKTDRDKLYENQINSIATFPGEGAVIWGQKTLQVAQSALDRINVMRMILRVRKILAKKALGFVFEPNVPATWDRFVNSARPDLERIQQNFGIDDFKLVLDTRTTTEDLIERNIMYGKVAIKPTRSAEFIFLDFFITDNVAGFEV